MDNDNEWGPWIEHDGRGCPCKGKEVLIVTEGWPNEIKNEGPLIACAEGGQSWDWNYWLEDIGFGPLCRVLKYRVRKPRGLVILESLLLDLPQKVDA